VRRRLAALALVGGLAGATPAGAAIDARLQGTFAMQGQLTVVDHIFGEHKGQQVTRTWTFVPLCVSGVCDRVTLQRDRSGRHLPDTVVLVRQDSGVYVGHGRFAVALYCAGRVRPRGGLALEKITVRITQIQTVAGVPYATTVSASYVNPKRLNLTRCPGGIGHDAATYTGQLSTALPTG
jgi:hypothetical protein